ncbi:DUF536 domain-containing protein [Mammaliicoccus sciuri]|uniref:DUF536 domain-containing protein n=1 Tax=Mammaliicoccus sciuri TaxID=1296 RepID=UPI003F542FC2
MDYSLKELSEKLSVTKMTILNHAKRLDIELKKVDNALVITNEQALNIGESINNQKPLNEKIDVNNIFNIVNHETEKSYEKEDINEQELQKDIIQLLNKQLEDKEKQISFLENQMNVKDTQINKLNETLDNQQKLLYNQQSLALQSNDRIRVLEGKLNQSEGKHEKNDKVEASKEEQDTNGKKVDDFYNDSREDSPKGFFSKLFKR